jgi:hypothetical protein
LQIETGSGAQFQLRESKRQGVGVGGEKLRFAKLNRIVGPVPTHRVIQTQETEETSDIRQQTSVNRQQTTVKRHGGGRKYYLLIEK